MTRLWLLLALLPALTMAQTLKTRWAAGVKPENAHREYPRPQMVRKNWVNLNGTWSLAIVKNEGNGEVETEAAKPILVPFPAESQLSGFHDHVEPGETMIYTRTFQRPKGDRVLIHFGAVDWQTMVIVNGKVIGTHLGGYDSFTFDITGALTDSGSQKLEVRVLDPTDKGFQPRGKQVLKPGGIFYTSTSGIWQTVWLESVPRTYIGDLKIETWPRAGQVNVGALVAGPYDPSTVKCRAEVLVGGKVVVRSESDVVAESIDKRTTNTLKVPDHIDWSPERPYLYDLRVTLIHEGKVLDQVTGYFGFREVSLVDNGHGQPRVALNGKPVFLMGPLDQGFWPDGIYTAPSDEALKYDLDVTKQLGFNMIRKHTKVEPERWYYWCDKLGILVLQDMPAGDRYIGPNDPDIQRSPESADDFRTELKAMIDTHFNHPSIITWVLYNEGWGQWDTPAMTKWLKEYDPSRLVDSTTGWADRGVGDYNDVHDYPGPGAPGPDPKRAIFLGEFGGLGLPVPGHMWQEKGWGYQSFKTSEELTARFEQLILDLRFLQAKGLSGAVYTQTTDCETELNGLMTYDRAMIKMDPGRVRKALASLSLPPPVLSEVVPTSESTPQTWRYLATETPGGKWMESSFDDSAWPSGTGGFGTPETPGSAVHTRWDSKDIYIRRTFTLDRDYNAGELLLRLSHDDDVEVFVDGRPVFATKGWTTSYRNLPLIALPRGQHNIAIHCHQNEGGQYVDAGLARIVESR